jgi:hypothetical protein
VLLAVTDALESFDVVGIDLYTDAGDGGVSSLCASGMTQRSVISSALKGRRYSGLRPSPT